MKLGLGLGINIIKNVGGGYDSAYMAALISYAQGQGDTLPSDPVQSELDAMLKGLEDDGDISQIDTLYVFSTDGGASFARRNIITPGVKDCTVINSPVHNGTSGYYTGSGRNGRLNSNWNPATAGGNYTQNSASLFAYITSFPSSPTGNHYVMELDGSLKVTMRMVLSGSTEFNGAVNSGFTKSAGASSVGYYTMDRPDSSNQNFYKNGSLASNHSTPSVAIPSANLILLNYINSSLGFDGNVGIIGGGGSIGSGGASRTYTRFSTYINNI